jgi:hypothetical protein
MQSRYTRTRKKHTLGVGKKEKEKEKEYTQAHEKWILSAFWGKKERKKR